MRSPPGGSATRPIRTRRDDRPDALAPCAPRDARRQRAVGLDRARRSARRTRPHRVGRRRIRPAGRHETPCGGGAPCGASVGVEVGGTRAGDPEQRAGVDRALIVTGLPTSGDRRVQAAQHAAVFPGLAATDRVQCRAAAARHQVQVAGRAVEQAAVGCLAAVERQRDAAAPADAFARIERQHDAGAVDDREPAVDVRVGRERSVAIDLGDADAQRPELGRGPGQQFARAPAAVAPGLRRDVAEADHAHGRACPRGGAALRA